MLDSQQQHEVEQAVKRACEGGDIGAATTLVIERYGPEILGYLFAVARNETDSSDAFALFGEHVWQGLSGFAWRSSLRTWVYTLARNALSRIRRDPHRRPHRQVPLSDNRVAGMAEKVRSATMEYLRTEFRDRVDALRAQLSAEDQTLLVLRVDRKMSWTEIAEIMADEPAEPAEPDEQQRAAAALRKRFERTKNALRKMMKN